MLRWLLLGVPHIFWLGAFIYLYNTKGRYHFNYDTISVALTTLEVLLVVFGVIGFGFVTIVAERRAREAAEPAARKAAEEVAQAEIPPETARQVEAYFERLGIDWRALPKLASGNDTPSARLNENDPFAEALDKKDLNNED